MPRSAGRITLATSDWLPFDVGPASEAESPESKGQSPESKGQSPASKGQSPTSPRGFGLSTADLLSDAAARERAVDPAHNVVLEASAGTGKTHVLVDRYLNLLSRGVEPANILAITFTRKAAAEMRGRILTELRKRADLDAPDRELWRE